MSTIRIVKKHTIDGKSYYVIQEVVTPDGKYIEWEGVYASYEAAAREADVKSPICTT